MKSGYLYIEVSPSHPGLIHLAKSLSKPSTESSFGDDPCIVYVARFDDIDAGMMHCHELLRFKLHDLNNRLYRADPLKAIAAIEADNIGHRRIFLHPESDSLSDLDLEQEISRVKEDRVRQNRIWQTIGKIAVGLLIAEVVLGL
ncbi:MAG: hypothetical protein ABW082_08400 [Sedimenticola sp.]